MSSSDPTPSPHLSKDFSDASEKIEDPIHPCVKVLYVTNHVSPTECYTIRLNASYMVTRVPLCILLHADLYGLSHTHGGITSGVMALQPDSWSYRPPHEKKKVTPSTTSSSSPPPPPSEKDALSLDEDINPMLGSVCLQKPNLTARVMGFLLFLFGDCLHECPQLPRWIPCISFNDQELRMLNELGLGTYYFMYALFDYSTNAYAQDTFTKYAMAYQSHKHLTPQHPDYLKPECSVYYARLDKHALIDSATGDLVLNYDEYDKYIGKPTKACTDTLERIYPDREHRFPSGQAFVETIWWGTQDHTPEGKSLVEYLWSDCKDDLLDLEPYSSDERSVVFMDLSMDQWVEYPTFLRLFLSVYMEREDTGLVQMLCRHHALILFDMHNYTAHAPGGDQHAYNKRSGLRNGAKYALIPAPNVVVRDRFKTFQYLEARIHTPWRSITPPKSSNKSLFWDLCVAYMKHPLLIKKLCNYRRTQEPVLYAHEHQFEEKMATKTKELQDMEEAFHMHLAAEGMQQEEELEDLSFVAEEPPEDRKETDRERAEREIRTEEKRAAHKAKRLKERQERTQYLDDLRTRMVEEESNRVKILHEGKDKETVALEQQRSRQKLERRLKAQKPNEIMQYPHPLSVPERLHLGFRMIQQWYNEKATRPWSECEFILSEWMLRYSVQQRLPRQSILNALWLWLFLWNDGETRKKLEGYMRSYMADCLARKGAVATAQTSNELLAPLFTYLSFPPFVLPEVTKWIVAPPPQHSLVYPKLEESDPLSKQLMDVNLRRSGLMVHTLWILGNILLLCRRQDDPEQSKAVHALFLRYHRLCPQMHPLAFPNFQKTPRRLLFRTQLTWSVLFESMKRSLEYGGAWTHSKEVIQSFSRLFWWRMETVSHPWIYLWRMSYFYRHILGRRREDTAIWFREWFTAMIRTYIGGTNASGHQMLTPLHSYIPMMMQLFSLFFKTPQEQKSLLRHVVQQFAPLPASQPSLFLYNLKAPPLAQCINTQTAWQGSYPPASFVVDAQTASLPFVPYCPDPGVSPFFLPSVDDTKVRMLTTRRHMPQESHYLPKEEWSSLYPPQALTPRKSYSLNNRALMNQVLGAAEQCLLLWLASRKCTSGVLLDLFLEEQRMIPATLRMCLPEAARLKCIKKVENRMEDAEEQKVTSSERKENPKRKIPSSSTAPVQKLGLAKPMSDVRNTTVKKMKPAT